MSEIKGLNYFESSEKAMAARKKALKAKRKWRASYEMSLRGLAVFAVVGILGGLLSRLWEPFLMLILIGWAVYACYYIRARVEYGRWYTKCLYQQVFNACNPGDLFGAVIGFFAAYICFAFVDFALGVYGMGFLVFKIEKSYMEKVIDATESYVTPEMAFLYDVYDDVAEEMESSDASSQIGSQGSERFRKTEAMPQAWICPKCGEKNRGNFCPKCGTRNSSNRIG